MVGLRSMWSAATMRYNNSSLGSWPIANISTTWVSLKSDTLAWVFNHAVWGPGAEREIDVKGRAESEKDCSGRGNRGLNSDEIIQFVSWKNRQTERWATATAQQPLGDLKLFHNHPILPIVLIMNVLYFAMLPGCGWNCYRNLQLQNVREKKKKWAKCVLRFDAALNKISKNVSVLAKNHHLN